MFDLNIFLNCLSDRSLMLSLKGFLGYFQNYLLVLSCTAVNDFLKRVREAYILCEGRCYFFVTICGTGKVKVKFAFDPSDPSGQSLSRFS